MQLKGSPHSAFVIHFFVQETGQSDAVSLHFAYRTAACRRNLEARHPFSGKSPESVFCNRGNCLGKLSNFVICWSHYEVRYTGGGSYMIVSFADKRTKDVFDGAHVRSLPPDLIERARRKLDRIHAAEVVTDLRAPPGNRLEKLVGDRVGQYSIRVSRGWRICF